MKLSFQISVLTTDMKWQTYRDISARDSVRVMLESHYPLTDFSSVQSTTPGWWNILLGHKRLSFFCSQLHIVRRFFSWPATLSPFFLLRPYCSLPRSLHRGLSSPFSPSSAAFHPPLHVVWSRARFPILFLSDSHFISICSIRTPLEAFCRLTDIKVM